MTKETKKNALAKAKADLLGKFRKLFGAPPLLECEDIDAYYNHVSALIEETKPQSIIELMDIKTAADKFVEMQRFARIKPDLIEHAYEVRRQHLEGQIVTAAASKCNQVRELAKTQLTKDLENLKGEPEQIKAETERLKGKSDEKLQAEIEKIEDESKELLEQLADTAASEADHAATFARWIDGYERADRLERGAWTQSLAALDQLKCHQAGLGLHRAQEIDDVEYHADNVEQAQLAASETTTEGAPDTVDTDSANMAVTIVAPAICATSISWGLATPCIDITEGLPPDASEPGEGEVPRGEEPAECTTWVSSGGEGAVPPIGMPPEASEPREAPVPAGEPADCTTSVSSGEEGAVPLTDFTDRVPPGGGNPLAAPAPADERSAEYAIGVTSTGENGELAMPAADTTDQLQPTYRIAVAGLSPTAQATRVISGVERSMPVGVDSEPPTHAAPMSVAATAKSVTAPSPAASVPGQAMGGQSTKTATVPRRDTPSSADDFGEVAKKRIAEIDALLQRYNDELAALERRPPPPTPPKKSLRRDPPRT